MKDHKGEISFPGGVVESGDPALLDTALRECNEEIGLAPADVTVLGQLDDIETASTGYLISPFVGLIPYPYAFQVNADEIEALIIVPLEALLKPSTSRRHTGSGEDPQIPAPIFRYEDHIIWGATARILLQLVDLIAHSTSAHLTSNAT